MILWANLRYLHFSSLANEVQINIHSDFQLIGKHKMLLLPDLQLPTESTEPSHNQRRGQQVRHRGAH